MRTVSAIAVICCLFISAALTIIVILVTTPTDDNDESQDTRIQDFQRGGDQRLDESMGRRDFGTKLGIFVPGIDYPHFNPEKKSMKDALPADPEKLPRIHNNTSSILVTTTTARRYPSTAQAISRNDLPSFTYHGSTAVPQFMTTSKQAAATLPKATGQARTGHPEKPFKLLNREPTKATTTQQHFQQKWGTMAPLQLPHLEALMLRENRNLEKKMELLREDTFSENGKIVGLCEESGLLYMATSNGLVRVLNPETGEQMEEIDLGGRIDRMTVTHDADVVVLNGTELVSYRDGLRFHRMSLHIGGKGLSVGEKE
ncbi:unnamed protein product, partial [Gongylonema pulchrum]|uniref:CNH domain-containing protein n=1 Tax=Gongylonema pulchrum TaxID=637853 RepID=A0A183D0D4_9BILA